MITPLTCFTPLMNNMPNAKERITASAQLCVLLISIELAILLTDMKERSQP